jgi:ribosomal protein S1
MKKIHLRQTIFLKNWLGCYDLSKERYFEGFLNKLDYKLTFGFKYDILLLKKTKTQENFHILKISQFETSFSCFFFNFFVKKSKKYLNSILLSKTLIRMQKKKKTINARIINIIKSGYAIGTSGLIGFLPKSRSFNCDIGFVYSFLMLSLDNYHFSFVFLQKKQNSTVKYNTCIELKRIQVLKKLILNR